LNALRATPANRLNDGRDFVPTNRWIVFGHHFAAIAGPGPLVGPTLAAQFGYLPGVLWLALRLASARGCLKSQESSLRKAGLSLPQSECALTRPRATR
jgi:carbon starvation protein